MARAEAYLHAKFRLDPSNRLARVHQRYSQTGQTDRQRTDSIGRTVLEMVAQKGIFSARCVAGFVDGAGRQGGHHVGHWPTFLVVKLL